MAWKREPTGEVLLSRRVRRISDMGREWRRDESGKGK